MDSESTLDDLMREIHRNIYLKVTYDLYRNTKGMSFEVFLIHALVVLAKAYQQLLEDLVSATTATNSPRAWQEPVLHDDKRGQGSLHEPKAK